ncbi:hypothetical protein KM043_015779 [Ampulex compressa]|nr:hypothetical protein KM043_015779 [Ampulex compressa]
MKLKNLNVVLGLFISATDYDISTQRKEEQIFGNLQGEYMKGRRAWGKERRGVSKIQSFAQRLARFSRLPASPSFKNGGLTHSNCANCQPDGFASTKMSSWPTTNNVSGISMLLNPLNAKSCANVIPR